MASLETSPRTRQRGLFLCLDGPDGGGKTTQVSLLADWLRAHSREVVTCRDPGGTAVGDRLRHILLDRATTHLTLRAEMLLYMASRAQLVDEIIRPALAEQRVVITDRFLLANIVYQGVAGGLPVDEVWRVGQAATAGLLPDLTLLLDVPAAVAKARVGAARDRIEDRPDDYHARVREGFLSAARDGNAGGCPYYPAPIVVLDASAEPHVVTERIQSEVERVLAVGPRS
jgi:dTMP kinase